jgi:hypothetical protein
VLAFEPQAHAIAEGVWLGGGDLRAGEVLHDGPEEPDQLPRDGNDSDLRLLSIGEVLVPLMEARLRFPRVRDDGGRLALLPAPDFERMIHRAA